MTIPRLARGRHLISRRKACLMEMAAFLAEEKWSDHPQCVHPALAAAARVCNDMLPDPERSRLTSLLPSLMGTAPEDSDTDRVSSLRLAWTGAAYAYSRSHSPQLAACALYAARHFLLQVGEWSLEDETALLALEITPQHAAAAQRLEDSILPSISLDAYLRLGVPQTLAILATGLDVEDISGYLTTLAYEYRLLADAPSFPVDETRWDRACKILGTV